MPYRQGPSGGGIPILFVSEGVIGYVSGSKVTFVDPNDGPERIVRLVRSISAGMTILAQSMKINDPAVREVVHNRVERVVLDDAAVLAEETARAKLGT